MQIHFHTQNLEVSEQDKEPALKKIQKLSHFASRIKDNSSEIRLDITYENVKNSAEAYYCRVTLFVPHDTLHAETRQAGLMDAVDEVVEKVRKQIEHYKDKTRHISERGGMSV